MTTFEEMKAKCLKDHEVKKEYDALGPEMAIARAILDARSSNDLTQEELAEKNGHRSIRDQQDRKWHK